MTRSVGWSAGHLHPLRLPSFNIIQASPRFRTVLITAIIISIIFGVSTRLRAIWLYAYVSFFFFSLLTHVCCLVGSTTTRTEYWKSIDEEGSKSQVMEAARGDQHTRLIFFFCSELFLSFHF